MAKNILFVSNSLYGKATDLTASYRGQILSLIQGQYGQSIPLEIRGLDDAVANLTGIDTVAGHKRDMYGDVTAIVGAFVLTDPDTSPQIAWTIAEEDTGTSGEFDYFLELSGGSQYLVSHPVKLVIKRDPAVNATPSPGLVGVTTAQKALLAVIAGLTGLVEMTAGSATGVAIQTFMRTFLSSATALAARANLLPSYTSNANKVLTVNAGANDVEWTTASGGGTWGSIGGTLANQTDLQTALDTKASTAALSNHEADTTGIHGISDTSALITTTHSNLTVTAHGGLVPQDAAILSKSGAYPLAAGDEAKIIECNGTFTITLPNGLDTGFQAVIVNIGSGVITLAATTTLTTKDSAVTLANQYGAATVYHAGSNVWRAFGDLS